MLIHFLLTVAAFASYVLLLWMVCVASEVRPGQTAPPLAGDEREFWLNGLLRGR